MSIPYRTRRALRSFLTVVLSLVLFAALALLCWLLWLNRYVIYSRDGAKLDFNQSVQYAPGQTPEPPEPGETVQVHNKQEEEENNPFTSNDLTRFSGFYVTLDQLTENFDGVTAQLEALPQGSTVLLELKDVRGYVYYTSSAGRQNPNFDTSKVDSLLQSLVSKGHYVIVQIPAFQEYYFIMENEWERVPYGLPKAGGNGSLWLDQSGPCYWLSPASDGTLTYLIQLVTELRSMGVDEVVFSDFRFPNTDSITFDSDKLEALNTCAAKLVKTCSTDTFCVSFTRSSADLTLPEGRTRLYLTGVNGADISSSAAQAGFADPSVHLVFLTESGDTRFDDYCVLRPLEDTQ